jgi:hypothetical protein
MNIQFQGDAKRVACQNYSYGLCSMQGYKLCRMHECEKYVLLPEAKWRKWHNERKERFRGRGVFGLLGGGMRK